MPSTPSAGFVAPASVSPASVSSQNIGESEPASLDYRIKYTFLYASAGVAASSALGIPLSFLLGIFGGIASGRYAANRSLAAPLAESFGHVGALGLIGFAIIVTGAAAGWLGAGKHEEKSLRLSEGELGPTSVLSPARIAGAGFGAAAMLFFLFVETWHVRGTSVSSRDWNWIVTAFKYALLAAGLVGGALIGYCAGGQEHERVAESLRGAPRRPSAMPRPAISHARFSQWVNGVDYGNWIIGFLSFSFPCMGILLWMAYVRTDEDRKTTAAAIGTMLGFGLAFFYVIGKAG